jgi:hypothetical protein
MAFYRVELECDAREVYLVEADSPEDAEYNWTKGDLIVSEVGPGSVVSIELEDE